ncbi:MAG: hypothetical protein N3F06_01105, partial [Nitrososphaerales archaeon]|nr:hypothetical protein [Nitrososphaerales archaeon]
MKEGYRGIVSYSEDRETLFELISKGRELADRLQTDVSAILLGERVEVIADELASYGADRIYIIEDPQLKNLVAEVCTDALSAAINQIKPEIVLIGATKRGKELAPRLAERLGTGCVSECVDLEVDVEKRDLIMKRVVFGGKVTSVHSIVKRPIIATIIPRIFEEKKVEGRKAQTITMKVETSPSKIEVLEVKSKEFVGGKRLEEASVIICGG